MPSTPKHPKIRISRPKRILTDEEEDSIYDFWRKYFGHRFSSYAAGNGIWPPDDNRQDQETHVQVYDLLSKRIARLALLLEDDMDRDKAIKLCDRDLWIKLRKERRLGKEIANDSIWYELVL